MTGHCRVHLDSLQRRYNNIQDRLVKALKTRGTVTSNQTVPGEVGDLALLRPDIVIRNDVKRMVFTIDVTVTFENRMVAFDEDKERKIQKYLPLAESLKGKGYTVDVDTVVVGSLGRWDWRNERIIRLLICRTRFWSTVI